MRYWRRILLGAALVALAVIAWRFLFPSAEAVIRKRLNQVASLASFPPNEGPLAKLANSQKLSTFFATDVELAIDAPGRIDHAIAGRDELLQAAMAARNQLSSLQVKFPDIVVTLAPDREQAVVDLTVTARIGGERDLYVQQMRTLFRKIKGDWLITRIETVKTLQ